MKKSSSLSRTKSLLASSLPAKRAQGLAVIAAFVLVGIFVLVYTHAATNPSSMEAEKGSLANGATVVNDGNASDGQGVQFGSLPSSTPAPTPTPTATPVSGSTCTNPTHTIAMDPNDPQAGISLGNFYLTNDTWNASGYKVASTMYICSPSSWYAMVTEDNNAKDGAVKSYPNVHEDFNEPKISTYHTISSSFAETSPHVGIYEWAYDIWLNGVADNNSTELMIWNDNFGQTPSGSVVATFTDGGRTYNVWKDGTYIAFVDKSNTTSGTVNLLDFFNFIISKGWIGSGSTIGQIDYGPEMVSTNGAPAKFEVNNFSLTAN